MSPPGLIHLVPPAGNLVAQRFEIGEVAGSGGMGTVYRARDLQTGAAVALKLLHAGGTGVAEMERFLREGSILSQLRHPGIVSYIAHGVTDEGQPFLAMEWLDGEDLAQRMSRQPLSVLESLALVRRAAEALTVAHQHGVVHRDLKPSNLFLCGGQLEQLKLLDFGIARRSTLSRAMTRTGAIVGTPEYMAPEQARGLRDLGPGADVFALGCVLFECLSGEPPFVAEHLAAVLAKILFEEPPLLRCRRGALPSGLTALLERMLAKSAAALGCAQQFCSISTEVDFYSTKIL